MKAMELYEREMAGIGITPDDEEFAEGLDDNMENMKFNIIFTMGGKDAYDDYELDDELSDSDR